MDKYSEMLANLPFDLLHIAQSFANDNKSPKIEPAHLLRALLHKSAGMVNYIEDTLDEDYYYLVDWADMRMKQCDKSPYPMKGIELSRDAQNVVKEAKEIANAAGLADINGPCLLAALVKSGVGFSYDQLKTLRREFWLCGKVEEDSRQLEKKRAVMREAERQLNSKGEPAKPRQPIR